MTWPPVYQARDISITAIVTDNGREFCGTERHPYELYRALNDIEHPRTKVKQPQTTEFVERFQQTVGAAFFSVTLRQKRSTSVEALQQLDVWLVHHTTERLHQGEPNLSTRPIDTVNASLKERALAEPAQHDLTRSVSQGG